MFGRGRFAPNSIEGSRLLAHELAHVVQTPITPANAEAIGRPDSLGELQARAIADRPSAPSRTAPVTPATAGTVQQVLEVRPPGRGEVSAFDRRQELIDRINAQSSAVTYRLDGRVIRYDVHDPVSVNSFDRQMIAFIDRAEVLPMRLIGAGGRVGGFPVSSDVLQEAYVDLDDLLSSSDLGSNY